MALRIACDLDGTVADMDAALQREAEQLFGPDVTVRSRGAVVVPLAGIRPPKTADPAPIADETPAADADAADDSLLDPPAGGGGDEPGKRPLTDREVRQLWAHVRRSENFWTTLDEIEPGGVARLGRSVAERGWEVIFLTQRPRAAGETTQRQSQRWLAAHGFELPSVYVMNGSRGLVAASLGLDAVIDDRAENAVDVATDSRAMSILVWRAAPDTVPPGTAQLGVRIVPSFAAALDLLDSLAVEEKPKGFIGRVRSALGW